MPAPSAIRNIVFDIGWVLVRLDYRPLLGFLHAHGARLADRDADIAAARSRGWRGIVHRDHARTVAALQNLQVATQGSR